MTWIWPELVAICGSPRAPVIADANPCNTSAPSSRKFEARVVNSTPTSVVLGNDARISDNDCFLTRLQMLPLLRPRNLGLLLSYLVLSSLPFFPLAIGRPISDPWQIVGLECLCWIVVWATFKRPAWFHWMLAPAFFALPVQIYLNVYYGQGISTHHLGIIAETSPKEAIEFLGTQVYVLAAVVLAVIVWFFTAWKAAVRTRDLDWNGRSRWLAIAILSVVVGCAAYGEKVGVITESSVPGQQVVQAKAAEGSGSASPATSDGEDEEDDDDPGPEVRMAAKGRNRGAAALPVAAALPRQAPAAGSSAVAWPKLPAWAVLPVTAQSFASTWPFGLSVQGYDFWQEREYLTHLRRASEQFKFGARQVPESSAPQVVVVVIGESSRYDRWSLNGYKRDTNPLLKKETNLVSFSDMITSVSATRLSVPVIMSRKPATESLKAGFAEKSFISAFKEAGFKTWWISNQMSFGKFDTPVSVFAKEADVTQFMNLGGFTSASSVDQILLDPLKMAMSDPSAKKLIVLHSLGNHWNYSHRYTREFDKWQPSLYGVNDPAYTNLKLKVPLNNSYDNSILYTDWFLSQVLGQLKESGQLSSLFFVADHGQTLYDGTCNLAFHGHNTQYEFHVPAFVWYSDLYRDAWPDKVAKLRSHQKSRLSTENVFHSLLDMEDIHYDGEHLDRSVFSEKLRRHKRYVDSYGWTDYDNANLKGDCHEVIGKGKPLAQEKLSP
ncbi:MAG: sulfatase family protein [Herminiimonas sp.]|nr:sulfatase family protein [Herminiimonas sp.]